MKYLTIVLCLLAMVLVTPATADVPPTDTDASSSPGADPVLDNLDQIASYLVATNFIASRTELRAIDVDPVPELISIATDRRKKPFVRERAIKCLSLFRDARSRQGFKDLLKSGPDRYFKLVVMAYLEAFGEDAVSDVKPYLTSHKSDVRLTVVQALGTFGGQEGFDLLVEMDKTENNPQVLARIRTYTQ